ncbi:MAG: sodium:calcium antiporter [Candidatus Paceibacterota bacterium]
MINLAFLAISLFLVIKSSNYAVKYASNLAHALKLPRYVVGFLVVAVISILPETFIAINSALDGIPSFGLGTLFGSNVADLTLVFTIIILSTAGGIRVNSKILESNKWYPFFIALPIFAGIDGYYSRPEGIFLIIAGAAFYYLTFRKNHRDCSAAEEAIENNHDHNHGKKHIFKNIGYLGLSMAVLLFGAHLTVKYGVSLAQFVKINPVFIGMLVVGLGTTLPEMIFSIRAVKHKDNCLALGDILGTVISDATIAVGVVALISPFSFPVRIIYITAMFMVLASVLLFHFMRTGRILTKKEAVLLLFFYAVFITTEYVVNILW